MNNWYNRITGVNQRSYSNPMQRAQFVANAMRNPVQFVKEQFPDVPENILNNPNAILNYLQQTRGNNFVQDMNTLFANGRR